MDRIRQLAADPEYRRYLQLTADYERQRQYCCHDFNHLLSVARITWILTLERGLSLQRPVVYAAALLHDLGRFAQYEDSSVDHAEASAALAEPLLLKHGFTPAETATIRQAIRSHRLPPQEGEDNLATLLAEADNLSRLCFDCPVTAGCYKFHRMPTDCGLQY